MAIHGDSSPWIRLDLRLWDPLIQGKPTASFHKGEHLFLQDAPSDFVYVVQSGRVRIKTTLVDGSEKQIYIGDTGAIIGEISCFRHHPYSNSAVSVTDCTVYKISRTQLISEMQRNWSIAELVLNSMSRKAVLLHTQIIELSFASVIQKTVYTLLRLVDDYGQPLPDGYRISIKFTHEDFSGLINASRPTVSNTFSSLAAAGIIKKRAGYYIVTDVEGLLRLTREQKRPL